jgi:hypothetical protein
MKRSFECANRLCAALALFGLCTAPVTLVRAQDYDFNSLIRPGLHVLSPLNGTWVQSGDTLNLNGEAFSNFPITMQERAGANGVWFDATSYTGPFVYDGFSDNNPARTDPTGEQWFNWHSNILIADFATTNASPIVTDGNGQRGFPYEWRFVRKEDDGSIWPFSHFGQNAHQCITDNESNGPIEVMDQCALEKDSVTVIVRCGRANQDCCTAGSCDDGFVCVANSCRARAANSPPAQNPPPASPPGQAPPQAPDTCVRVHATTCYDDFGNTVAPPTPSCDDGCGVGFDAAAGAAKADFSRLATECVNVTSDCCWLLPDEDMSWCGSY